MRRTASGQAKANAKILRRQMTGPEKLLWSKLREWRNQGYAIRRQHTIGPYVVDFVCLVCLVVVEVDGRSHDEAQLDRDQVRDAYLRGLDFEVVRVTNDDVLRHTDAVLTHLWEVLQARRYELGK